MDELFELFSRWSGLKITNRCCTKIPLFVVKYENEKVWLLCNEHFKMKDFRKYTDEVLPIENPSEFGIK